MGRIVTGLILAIAWLLLLFMGPYLLFCLIIALVGGIALYEFLYMSSPKTEQKHIIPVVLLGLFPIAAASLWGEPAIIFSLYLTFLIVIIISVAAYPALDNSLVFISRLWFGIFYVGFCSAHLILLRSLPQGIYWLLFLTAVTVFSDTGAYYIGRFFGNTKLYAALSPGKTRAGAVGGIIGGMLGGLAVAIFFLPELNLGSIALLGLILSAVGIVGDLVESLIKRVSGVKDSGQILPGHGGILDRFDSLLLTAPVLYYVLYLGHEFLLK
jgi:phosphatidate cytidylyltransferase